MLGDAYHEKVDIITEIITEPVIRLHLSSGLLHSLTGSPPVLLVGYFCDGIESKVKCVKDDNYNPGFAQPVKLYILVAGKLSISIPARTRERGRENKHARDR